MIELHTWTTPNGYKVSIALEELGLPYTVVPVDIGAGEQHRPEFLALSPNNKIPAIVDTDGPGGARLSLFESGAILLYLAEKTGKLLPKEPLGRYRVIEWLMFQMGSVGPMLGQAHHFRQYAPEPVPYAIQRYTQEAQRLYRVIDQRLSGREYIADELSIADFAIFPWLRSWERQGVELEQYPHVQRWLAALDVRPAVQRGLAVLSERASPAPLTDAQKAALFGTQR